MTPVQTQISDSIRRARRGSVFTPKDFVRFGSRDAVDQALGRLVKAGEIERLGRGLYHFPRINGRLGIALSPDADAIANALARQTGSRIAPSGATAVNLLGLSTQVPANPVYVTDGRSRTVRVDKVEFILKHVTSKDLPDGGGMSTTVVQALRYLGREATDSTVVSHLRQRLSPKQRERLLDDAGYATGWIAEAMRRIAADHSEMVTNG